MKKIQSKITVSLLYLFLVVPFFCYSQERPFTLKIYYKNSSVDSLGIGEAYWRSFKPLHAAKIESNSVKGQQGIFTFKGKILYPTAVRIYPVRTYFFTKLIFIDTGYQEITLVKKDSSYVVEAKNAIEQEHERFLNEVGAKKLDDQIDPHKLLKYVKKNPNSYVALFAIINQAFNYPYLPIYDTINSTFGVTISKTQAFQFYEDRYSPKTVGPIDTNVLGASIEGKNIALSEFKNNSFILLDFWASWCVPCRKMVPHLKDLYKKYHQKGLEIISISSSLGDVKNDWKVAVKKEGMESWINLFSEKPYAGGKDLAIRYGITTVPTILLLDKKGVIIGRYIGYSEDDSASDLDKKLFEIFK